MSSDGFSDYDGDFDQPKQKKKRNPPAEPRKLMRWNPDVDQLVLLSVDAVCARLGVALPWEEIAKEVEPFLTAEGVKQHLGKIRLARMKAGRRVPSRPEKGTRRKSRANQIKQEEKEEVETGTPTKLAGLLYHGSETQPKKVRTPKKSASVTTPGGSTGKAGRKRIRSTLDRDAVLGAPSMVTPTKMTTGKRGRKAKDELFGEGDSDYAETPTKKAKTGTPNYNFRAISKDVKYKDDAPFSDNEEEDEENLLTNEEVDDGDYEEEDAANYDKMEDVKSQHAPSPPKSKNINMVPPPVFKADIASSEKSSGNKISQQSPVMLATNFQPEPVQPNPFQDHSVAADLYHGFDQGRNAEPAQNIFSNDAMPRGNPGMNWLQSSMMPLPVESAVRSSLNQSPRATQKEETAMKDAIRLKNTDEDLAQQTSQMPKKNQNVSDQVKNDARTPAGSPFDLPEQTNEDIKAINDTWVGLGVNNYTTTASNMNMTHYSNMYVQDGCFDNYPMAYYNGNGMGNPNLHINTDPASVFSATGFINSPDDYNTSAGTEIFDNPLNFAPNMTYTNNFGGMPVFHSSGASTQQHSQASALMPTATHTDSFDSMATTIHGSQTDEAKQYLNIDGGNDSQAFGDGMDYTNLNGGSFDAHFGDLFPDGEL